MLDALVEMVGKAIIWLMWGFRGFGHFMLVYLFFGLVVGLVLIWRRRRRT